MNQRIAALRVLRVRGAGRVRADLLRHPALDGHRSLGFVPLDGQDGAVTLFNN